MLNEQKQENSKNEEKSDKSTTQEKIPKKEKSDKQPFFLMTLEDNLGECQQIKIYKNSNASELAFNFCKDNNLDFTSMKYIKANIKEVIKKFNESHPTNTHLYNNNDSIKEVDEEDYLTEGTIKSNEKTKYKDKYNNSNNNTIKKSNVNENYVIENNNNNNSNNLKNFLESEEDVEKILKDLAPKKIENISINKKKLGIHPFKLSHISPKQKEINENFQKFRKNTSNKNINVNISESENCVNHESENNSVKISCINEDNKNNFLSFHSNNDIKKNSEIKNSDIKNSEKNNFNSENSSSIENGVPVLNQNEEEQNEDFFTKNNIKMSNLDKNIIKKNLITFTKDFEKEEEEESENDKKNDQLFYLNKLQMIDKIRSNTIDNVNHKDFSFDANSDMNENNFDSESTDLVKIHTENNTVNTNINSNYSKDNNKIKNQEIQDMQDSSNNRNYLKRVMDKKYFYSNPDLNSNEIFGKNVLKNKNLIQRVKTNKENKSKSLSKNKQRKKNNNIINAKKNRKKLDVIGTFFEKIKNIRIDPRKFRKISDNTQKNKNLLTTNFFQNSMHPRMETICLSKKSNENGCKTPPIKHTLKKHKFLGNFFLNSVENKRRNKCNINIDNTNNNNSEKVCKSESDLIDIVNKKISSPQLMKRNYLRDKNFMHRINKDIRRQLSKNNKFKQNISLKNVGEKINKNYLSNTVKNLYLNNNIKININSVNSKYKLGYTFHNTHSDLMENYNCITNPIENIENNKLLQNNHYQELIYNSNECANIQEKFKKRIQKFRTNQNKQNCNSRAFFSCGRRTKKKSCQRIGYLNDNKFKLNKLALNKSENKSKFLKHLNNEIKNTNIVAVNSIEDLNKNFQNNYDIDIFKKLEPRKTSKRKNYSTSTNKNPKHNLRQKKFMKSIENLNEKKMYGNILIKSAIDKKNLNLLFSGNDDSHNNQTITINSESKQKEESINIIFNQLFFILRKKNNKVSLMDNSFSEKLNLFPNYIKKIIVKMVNIFFQIKRNPKCFHMTTTDIMKLPNNSINKNKTIISMNRATFVNEMVYIYKYCLDKDSKKKLLSLQNDIHQKNQVDNYVPFQPMSTYGDLRFDTIFPISPFNENDNAKYRHDPKKGDFSQTLKDVSEEKKRRKNGIFHTLE